MILVTHFLFFVPIGPFSYVLSHKTNRAKDLLGLVSECDYQLAIAVFGSIHSHVVLSTLE